MANPFEQFQKPGETGQDTANSARAIDAKDSARKSENPIDLMEGQVIEGLGTTGRELELKIRIKESEDTVARDLDHYHIEGWKRRLENDRKALVQNEAALDKRIHQLPAAEATQFREEYERTLRTIMAYREADSTSQGNLESLTESVNQRKVFEQKLDALETRLPKI